MKNYLILFSLISFFPSQNNLSEISSSAEHQVKDENFAEAFMNFYNKPHQSYITLEKLQFKSMPFDHKAILKATIYDSNKALINGTININGDAYGPNPYVQYIYSGPEPEVICFNQENSISFKDSSGAPLFKTQFQIPLEVTILSESDSISEGQIIEYNAAPSNLAGLACLAVFSTSNPYNANFANYREVTNVIHVATDNGSFAITDELLKDIPNGAMIDLVLVRGAIKSIETPNNSIGILAYSNSILSTVVHQ